MNILVSDLIPDLPCTYCGANLRQDCRTKSGRATTTHADRYYLAVRVYTKLATAWENGHTACSHACVIYDGLGERCVNPYDWRREHAA